VKKVNVRRCSPILINGSFGQVFQSFWLVEKELEDFGPTAFSIHVPCISIYPQDYSFGAKC
jgi:hypothetical protein